jgi:hypothetical protein
MGWQLDTVVLPDDMFWSDEFSWTPVAQLMEYSVAGSMIIQESERQTGRTVTLKGDMDRCWVTREDIATLYSWANTTEKEMILTFPDTTTHTVMFDMTAGSPIETVPLVEGAEEDDDSFRRLLSLKLIIID